MRKSPTSNTPRRRPSRVRRVATWLAWLLLSFAYYLLASMLLIFGYIVGWDNEPGRPLAGIAMIVAGLLIFLFMPRLIKRMTGREVLTPRYPGA